IDLKGKIAVVTGGCSGIGRGTVGVLRRPGARVACVDVQDEKGHALAKELGDGVLYVHADVTSEDEVAAAFGRVVEDFGGVDTPFNNAGGAAPTSRTPTGPREDGVAAPCGRVVEPFGGTDTLFNTAAPAEPLDSDPF